MTAEEQQANQDEKRSLWRSLNDANYHQQCALVQVTQAATLSAAIDMAQAALSTYVSGKTTAEYDRARSLLLALDPKIIPDAMKEFVDCVSRIVDPSWPDASVNPLL